MHVIYLEGIGKKISGLTILGGINLRVQKGERRAIIGPNGAGKTTLFKIIAGELKATEGKIFMLDKEITHFPVYRRSKMGLIKTSQQSTVFHDLTVKENMLLAISRNRQRRLGISYMPDYDPEILAKLNLYLDEWSLLPYASKKAAYLSHGVQRRLELAMAFSLQPKVLLLDEPTAGLETSDIKWVIKKLQSLDRDVTLLFIDHNMETVFSVADYITVLHHGQLLGEGSPDDISTDLTVQNAYLGR